MGEAQQLSLLRRGQMGLVISLVTCIVVGTGEGHWATKGRLTNRAVWLVVQVPVPLVEERHLSPVNLSGFPSFSDRFSLCSHGWLEHAR